MPPTTNPIDLTTLAAVKQWAGETSTGLDQEIQDIITAFSLYALHITGRGPADGSVPAASPFNSVVSYDEFYDGNGNDRLPIRNWPIQSVTNVIDTGFTIPASQNTTSPGWVIDGDRKFIVLRGFSVNQSPYSYRTPPWARLGFSLGAQNVEVQYTAGFSATPFDLSMCARKVCALNYKRTAWIGTKSNAMAAGAGTVSFNDWEMDKEDQRVLMYYAARAA